jgi:hypothetical protein
MPMTDLEDFPGGDRDKDWCVQCARPDGSLKSYDEALAGMTDFIMGAHGVERHGARAIATDIMSNMPAWRASSG